MKHSYTSPGDDEPTYILSISIDGQVKKVTDYVGTDIGMPQVITDLQDAVDSIARTNRWVDGADGLVQALRNENFDFRTFAAHVILKQAASHGQANTVRELMNAGVPLDPLPTPKSAGDYESMPFHGIGWLGAASNQIDVLRVLMNAGVSKFDQNDKDIALARAAFAGNLVTVKELIGDGANPDADLSDLTFANGVGVLWVFAKGAESILIYAAESQNPQIVREILRYHPRLEARDHDGRTAMFAAVYGDRTSDDARKECVRLLAEAGADVNARDNLGNTPIHMAFIPDIDEELLNLGADVNARNNDGETPIFNAVDDAIPLLVQHGADLTIRNHEGLTVMEAAKHDSPSRQAALRKAIQDLGHK